MKPCPIEAAALALDDLATVANPCVKARQYTAELLYRVPLSHPLRRKQMPFYFDDAGRKCIPCRDIVLAWAQQVQRCRPHAPTADELHAWARELRECYATG
jgi:hypothetical protein